MEWRPIAGLTREDEGTFIERVIASVVLEQAVIQHNADVEKAKKKSGR